MARHPIGFARLYDAQYASYEEDLPFWSSLVKQYGQPILELGCGCGRVLLPLLTKGASAIGLDLDPAMLAIARGHMLDLPGFQRENDSLICMDMLAMGFGERFALAIAPLNTLAGFDDLALNSILQQTTALLSSGGALACDLPNPFTALDPEHDPEEILDEYVLSDLEIGVQVRAKISFTTLTDVVRVEWHYDLFHPTGDIERFTHEEPYHLRSQEALAAIGLKAGFETMETFGDYDLSPYVDDSPRLLVCFMRTP